MKTHLKNAVVTWEIDDSLLPTTDEEKRVEEITEDVEIDAGFIVDTFVNGNKRDAARYCVDSGPAVAFEVCSTMVARGMGFDKIASLSILIAIEEEERYSDAD